MKSDQLKVVFLGTPAFAVPALSALIDGKYEIIGVITQPDRHSGRGKQITFSAVKELALKHNLPIYQPETKGDLTKIIQELKPDLAIVAAYGIIIEREALHIPKYGFLNIHGSILPEYRGPSPVTAAILDGKTETGVTIMKLSEKMDTGDILAIDNINIAADDTSETLMSKLSKLGAKLLLQTIPGYLTGEIKPVPQDESKAIYCRLIYKEDGEVKVTDTTMKILLKIRAYTPWPGVYTFDKGKRVKILEAKLSEIAPKRTGLISTQKTLLFATNQGALEINLLQPEGKKPMLAKEYINGLN